MLSGKPEKDNSIEVLKILNKISEKLKIAKASITKTHNKAIQNITNSLKRITSKLEEFEIGESKSIFDNSEIFIISYPPQIFRDLMMDSLGLKGWV